MARHLAVKATPRNRLTRLRATINATDRRWTVLTIAIFALLLLSVVGFIAATGGDGPTRLDTDAGGRRRDRGGPTTSTAPAVPPGADPSGDSPPGLQPSGDGNDPPVDDGPAAPGDVGPGNPQTGSQPGPKPPTTAPKPPEGQQRQVIRFDGWEAPWAPGPRPIGATATSGLAVQYSVTSGDGGTCEILQDRLVAIPEGLPMYCTIRASQPGDAEWLAATPVERTVVLALGVSTVRTVNGYPKVENGAWTIKFYDVYAVAYTVHVEVHERSTHICAVESREEFTVKIRVLGSGKCKLTIAGDGDRVYRPEELVLEFSV